MVKYLVVFGYFSEIVELEEETTNYGYIVDVLIDKLEEEGKEGCFISWGDTVEQDGEYQEDVYIIGGNHGRLLYHGGNLRVEKVEG